MVRTIAYDLTRLFLGPLSLSPRGIDRVDLALAEHVFPDDGTANLGVLPTPWGVRCIDGPRVRRGLESLKALWTEQILDDGDPQLDRLFARLTGEVVNKRLSVLGDGKKSSIWARMYTLLRATGITIGKPVRTATPEGAIYINVGQIGLAVPIFHKWLDTRRDVTCAIMLHDAIPLEYPQYVHPASVAHHRRMIRTAARHSDALIMTTCHARDSVMAIMKQMNRIQVPILVRALPLPSAFAEPRQSYPRLVGIRYFVVCATVEPRKNLTLLLRVWQRLIFELGMGAPHLVIVGSRGWNAGEILQPLEESSLLRARVIHVAGLSSPALARFMLGASAVLCPSVAEGFGLPVLEANALGVPTIASDIAAHREIASEDTVLLSPDDVQAWKRAVLAVPTSGARSTPTIPTHSTQREYGFAVEEFLQECATALTGVIESSPSIPSLGETR